MRYACCVAFQARGLVVLPARSVMPVLLFPPSLACSVIQDEHEGAAKKGLAVLTEMWRRHVSAARAGFRLGGRLQPLP